jgi:hypothetical protein
LLARGWTLPGEIEANSGNTTLLAAGPLAPTTEAAGFFSALADLLCFGAGADPTRDPLATLEAAPPNPFVGFATRLEDLAFFVVGFLAAGFFLTPALALAINSPRIWLLPIAVPDLVASNCVTSECQFKSGGKHTDPLQSHA